MSFTTREKPTPSRSRSKEPSTGRRSGSGSACCSMHGARTYCASKVSSTSARRGPSSSTACSTSSIRQNTSTGGPTRTTAPGSSSSPDASVPKSCWTLCWPSADCSERGLCPSTPSRPYRSRNPLKDLAKWVMGPLTTPVRRCGVSVKVAQRPPVSRDARPGRRHRHLGRAAGDERGKDHTDGSSVPVADVAREQEPGSTADNLGSGRDARIGWLEAETVSAFDGARSLFQLARQVQEFSGTAAGGYTLSQVPPGLRRQCCGYKEASRLKGWVHGSKKFARSWVVVAAILASPPIPRYAWRGECGEHERSAKLHA